MSVTAAMVKELREKTGAGMMDCKKALVESGGDMQKAIDYLREKGLASAEKRAGRIAAEGLVRLAFSPDGTNASMIEVNAETDFVSKNEEFVAFVDKLSDMALEAESDDLEAFMALSYGEEGSVKDALTAKIAKIGENMNIRRIAKLGTDGVRYVGYLHGGGSLGVIVGLKSEAALEELTEVGRDVAMQVASMNPQFVDESEIGEDFIEHERQILIAQAMNEGKPKEIVEKMVIGRLKKTLKEICLMEQPFVKDSEVTVRKHVENVAKELGKEIAVVEMARFKVGEGIEKKEEDFAEEVAKQMQG